MLPTIYNATISFAVTAEGTISLGVYGALTNELTHTLTIGLLPANSAPLHS
jgi:hypothetical protein